MYCKLTFEKKSLWMNFFFKLCTYLWISSFIHSRLPTTDFCRYEWKSFVTIFRVQLRRNCHHVVTYNCKISNIVFCCCCSVAKSYPALCNPMDSSMSGFPVLYYLPEIVQIHVHWVRDGIQPSHPLSPPSPPDLNLSQHQGLFQRVHSSCQVDKILDLQHQSFQWIFKFDVL